MKAFINCKYTKEQAVQLAWQHYKQDQYLKGTYGEGVYGTSGFKGCSVGCMADGLHHNYPELFGISPQIAYLSDSIFEGLNEPESAMWTPQLFEAIQRGSDTKAIFHKFTHFILVDPEHGVSRFNDCDEIKNIAKLHLKTANGEIITDAQWDTAHDVAAASTDTAYEAALRIAIYSTYDLTYASYVTAYVSIYASAYAAYADNDTAAHTTREKRYQIMRDKLIALFESEEKKSSKL